MEATSSTCDGGQRLDRIIREKKAARASLFNHLVGAQQQRRRNLEAEGLAARLMTSFIVGDFAQSIDSRK
jgi:hypothetical protein